jgi:hypothetical protein
MSRLLEDENMSQPDAQPVPNYVTCPCQHCSGKIEFDAIPVSKGGSNTARNIELLCEKHNRSKRDSIQ